MKIDNLLVKDGVNEEKLNNFSKLFDTYYDQKLPIPYFYPTIDGNIQGEISLFNKEISFEINLDSLTIYYHSLDLIDDSVIEDEFWLYNINGWDALNEQLLKECS